MTDDLSRRMTIVFEVNDRAAFEPLMAEMQKGFLREDGAPWRITAMSSDDEMTRVNLIEEAAERFRSADLRDAIEAITECPNLTEWSWEAYEAGETA